MDYTLAVHVLLLSGLFSLSEGNWQFVLMVFQVEH